MDEAAAARVEAYRLALAKGGRYNPSVTDPKHREELPGELNADRIALLSWAEHEFQPIQDHVIIELEPPEVLASGIVIPASAHRREKMVQARVISVGPGMWSAKVDGLRLPMLVKPGDRVLVKGNPGWEVGPFRVLRQGAIEAVIE